MGYHIFFAVGNSIFLFLFLHHLPCSVNKVLVFSHVIKSRKSIRTLSWHSNLSEYTFIVLNRYYSSSTHPHWQKLFEDTCISLIRVVFLVPFSDMTICSSLILAIYRTRVRCETMNDLAHSREFVSIRARNPVQGSVFHGWLRIFALSFVRDKKGGVCNIFVFFRFSKTWYEIKSFQSGEEVINDWSA